MPYNIFFPTPAPVTARPPLLYVRTISNSAHLVGAARDEEPPRPPNTTTTRTTAQKRSRSRAAAAARAPAPPRTSRRGSAPASSSSSSSSTSGSQPRTTGAHDHQQQRLTLTVNVPVPVRTHGFSHLPRTTGSLTPKTNTRLDYCIINLFTFVVRSSSLFSSSALSHYSHYYLVTITSTSSEVGTAVVQYHRLQYNMIVYLFIL